MTDEDEFDEAFKGFGEEPETPPAETPPVDPATPPAAPVAAVEPPKPVEEPAKDEPAKTPEAPEKDTPDAPAGDADKKEEEPKPATPPDAPVETPPAPKPLTLDDIKGVINDVRTEERTSGQALEQTIKEVMNAYYPEGLSNVLVDQKSGKELRTPQDVVDATGGEMPIDQAAQWLMNEQFKLDQNVAKINEDAKNIAETTLKFKQDGIEVLTRYEPIFKAYPQIQQKIWDQYIKLVKADNDKGVIISAPDMREYYDLVLEPYRLAFEHQSGQPGTAPTTPEAPAAPVPGTDDILDEGGDGGVTAVNDPNDFAQQVTKELAKEF